MNELTTQENASRENCNTPNKTHLLIHFYHILRQNYKKATYSQPFWLIGKKYIRIFTAMKKYRVLLYNFSPTGIGEK